MRRAASVGCAVSTSCERDATLDSSCGTPSSRANDSASDSGTTRSSTRVGAAAADPVLLLGDVRELEVERERAQHARLPLERQRRDRGREVVVRGPAARGAGERPDALDVVEERLVLLLDEHPAEQVAEHADVAPERGVGGGVLDGHPASVGRNGRKTAQRWRSDAGPALASKHGFDPLRQGLGEPRRAPRGGPARPALRRPAPRPRGHLAAGVRVAPARGQDACGGPI